MLMDCTTILLIFNEEQNIEPLTKSILDVYKKSKISGEVLLVDDGSIDNSPKVCDTLANKYDNVQTIHHSPNKGRSYAIQTGFKHAKGDVIILMDGDRQYNPDEIPQFLEKINDGYDVISGYRTHREDKFIRKLISRVYNRWIIQRSLNLDVRDQNSGFKAFKKKAAQGINFNPEGYAGLHRFILPLAKLNGYSIAEIPISHYPRPAGKSYIKAYTVPIITLLDYLKFKKEHKVARNK
jgi:glycosyltransferase involved in cell wall biosynthesis